MSLIWLTWWTKGTSRRWKWRGSINNHILGSDIHIHLFFLFLDIISGKAGGLTDLTGAAAANGLVSLSGDHIRATKDINSINGIYGIHPSNVASSFNAIGQGGAPIWRIEPPRSAVFSNSTGARVECVATGAPPPTVEWYKEDQLITHNIHGLRIVMTNGTLVFPPFK